MSNVLLLVPTGVGVGLTTVVLGLSRAFEEQGLTVKTFKSVDQNKTHKTATTPHSILIHEAEELLSEGKKDILLEEILENFSALDHDADMILVYGLIALQQQPYIANLNLDLANTLDAKIIIVTTAEQDLDALSYQIEITARYFGGIDNERVVGCIINKASGPNQNTSSIRADLNYLYQHPHTRNATTLVNYQEASIFRHKEFELLACIPWNTQILAPRMQDVMQLLNARVVVKGDLHQRRVQYMTLYAKNVQDIFKVLLPGALVVTPSDRSDVIMAVCLAALSGINLAGILLTNAAASLDPQLLNFCQEALKTGLPILAVSENSFNTAINLHQISAEIPDDDQERIELVKNYVAPFFRSAWIKQLAVKYIKQNLSPAAFRYHIIQMAHKANKKIVLPEGTEPRTIAAAAICAERKLAQCILIGEPSEIYRIAQNHAIYLPSDMAIINPNEVAEHYVAPLVELRKVKGMTEVLAKEYLLDPVVLGTMMVQQGDADGLVSGAIHTTANTIRPALQLIKMQADTNLVSSIFFMCLPNRVMVFGDCAVVPDPNAEALAEIAIQSADSAKIFGIEPLVAMISYSTGSSGSGDDVEKVKAATELVKQKRPDIIIDGPLQYDAAFVPEVAALKAPKSPVAGKASVFIFPDLNTGNTTYKAVQRSADALCIGPMLQGLRKPVNDLSRGATIDDIVYTIAITAIQAGHLR